jgi:tetratricopeptide (TPR) repeat protein
MTCEHCTNQLGDAVDGTLSRDEQAQIDTHCRECDACRALLSDLMDIRAAAASLDRLTPSPEVWNAISASVKPSRSAFAPSWAALATAAALVMMLGAAAWFDLGSSWRRNEPSGTDLARAAASELQLAEQHYENAIKSLEQLAVNKDRALDPAVAAEIAESLQSIDRAITDSRAALKSEPDSLVAQTSLLEALRMKVALLQETVSLMNARS